MYYPATADENTKDKSTGRIDYFTGKLGYSNYILCNTNTKYSELLIEYVLKKSNYVIICYGNKQISENIKDIFNKYNEKLYCPGKNLNGTPKCIARVPNEVTFVKYT